MPLQGITWGTLNIVEQATGWILTHMRRCVVEGSTDEGHPLQSNQPMAKGPPTSAKLLLDFEMLKVSRQVVFLV